MLQNQTQNPGTTDININLSNFIDIMSPIYAEFLHPTFKTRYLHWDFIFANFHFGYLELPVLKRQYVYSNRPNDPYLYEVNKYIEGLVFSISVIGIIIIFVQKI